jgi:hypothetical protein
MRVIPRALLRVRENFIGGLDFGKLLRSDGDIVYVAVGMEFESFPAICFLDPRPG